MTSDPLHIILGATEPPTPGAELRSRTLVAARAALLEAPMDSWARLAASRPIRLAWAVAVAALVIANILVTKVPHSNREGAAVPVAALARQTGELADVAAVGRLTVRLPGWQIGTTDEPGPADERSSS